MASSPALMAGLPTSSATVCVGPPLFWRPAGSSCGSVLLSDAFAELKPQLVPSSRLWLPSVIGPAQLCPEEVVATSVLVSAGMRADAYVRRDSIREGADRDDGVRKPGGHVRERPGDRDSDGLSEDRDGWPDHARPPSAHPSRAGSRNRIAKTSPPNWRMLTSPLMAPSM